MTIDELIGRLQGLGLRGDTEVFFTADNDGTFLASGVNVVEGEQDNYPADWNMPDLFVEIVS